MITSSGWRCSSNAPGVERACTALRPGDRDQGFDDTALATPDEVLTIREVAALLKVIEKTMYAMAQTGALPASMIRGQWCVKQTELDRRIDPQPRGGGSGEGNGDGC